MEVRNYSYMDEAEIINSNGQHYAVGKDEGGYISILVGEVTQIEGEEFFWAYDEDKDLTPHIQLSPDAKEDFLNAL